jgi:hypothetical protein
MATQDSRIERNVGWIAEYLKKHPCKQCGETRIVVLEFHHRDPKDKKYRIAQLSGQGNSLDRLIKEVEKCDVLCANCHRLITAQQFNYRILKFV